MMLQIAVRSLFVLTRRARAAHQARRYLRQYLALSEGLSPEAGSRSVVVPPMRGVDEDMRDWSFFMILEHNRIVNRSISATVQQLARDEPLSGAAVIDPKTGVMPSASAGEEQVRLFEDSVTNHLKAVQTLGPLRGTRTTPHPIFGAFDAHKWHCMLAFHLKIHYPQAAYVVRATTTENAESGLE